MDRRMGDNFSDGYPATRPTRYWCQKICAQIDARLAYWNHGAFEKFICDSYTADM